MKDYSCFNTINEKLLELGYIYEGDLGIKDRLAYKYQNKEHLMEHHLYLCPEFSEELKRHLAFRNHLRICEEDRILYEDTKKNLAKQYKDDREGYSLAKEPVVKDILSRCSE